MLLLRVVLLELLVCFHIIGGAVLFRRLFPRESPWLGFFLPTLAVMAAANFIEHFVALPVLGWLLPFTIGGLLWAMIKPGFSWEGLRFPIVVFLIAFTFALGIKCLQPDISSNTEGTADLTRVLDFSLGDKLPPTDCWMPPLDHGGYYEFQHYGASLLKRLLGIDLGSSYNMGFTLLNALVCLAGTGVAYRIAGERKWVGLATLLVLMASFTGSAPILFFHHMYQIDWPDFRLSIDIHESWDDADNLHRNPFTWYLQHIAHHPTLRLFPPGYNIFCSEFHANLGGHFMVLLSLLAGIEIFRFNRTNWGWIVLLVSPFYCVIMAAWYFFIVAGIAYGSIAVALASGRRPLRGSLVFFAAGFAAILIWPTLQYMLAATDPQPIFFTTADGRTPLWTFLIQWWPVLLPWLALLFVWEKMPLFGRWMHVAIAVMLIGVEFITFGDRGLSIEKMWGAIYGAGLVTLLPLVFIQPGLFFRGLTALLLVSAAICLGGWTKLNHDWVNWGGAFMRLEGDSFLVGDPQKKRLLQVMRTLHAVTILPGKSDWSYTPAPAIITFSENRSYVAWFYQEIQCGHGGEAEYRNKLNNQFYAGTLDEPLAFLEDNNISAVMIWPDDNISNTLLDQMKRQIGPDFYYVDCKMDGPNNAGLFMRRPQRLPVIPPAPPPPFVGPPAPHSAIKPLTASPH